MRAHDALMYISGLVAGAGDELPTAEQWAKIREITEKYVTQVAVEKLSGVREDGLSLERVGNNERNRLLAEQAYKKFVEPLGGRTVKLSDAATAAVHASNAISTSRT